MINSFVFEEMEKGNILSLLYIMMLCTVFINKYWKKCFFLNWQLAVKYLTHWKSNSFMNNKLNGNHPEVIVNLLHIIFLRNTVKDCIQHWFLFKPSSLYFATSCKKKTKKPKTNQKALPQTTLLCFGSIFHPLEYILWQEKSRSSVYGIHVEQNEKKCMTLFYQEKLFVLSWKAKSLYLDWYFIYMFTLRDMLQ